MKMVNNGYVSRVPQDLEGTIEDLQQGGSGGGGGGGVVYLHKSSEPDLTEEGYEIYYLRNEAGETVSCADLKSAFDSGKVIFYTEGSYAENGGISLDILVTLGSNSSGNGYVAAFAELGDPAVSNTESGPLAFVIPS